MRFHRLFSPFEINGMKLKNRIAMTAIQANYTPNGYCSERFINFYEARAKGGAGLLIVGGCRFDVFSGSTQDMMSLLDDSYIPGYKAFTDRIHQHGTKVAVQLYHAGRYAKQKSLPEGKAARAPSAVYATYTHETPQEMTTAEIQETIRNWADGAVRAKKAGFDAVEIVGSAGYLICQFLSPVTNLRTDEYGGSWANRTRFPLEVLRAIREAVGPDYPIIFRIAGNDFMPGSNTNADAVAFAKLLDEAGVDLISVTGGWHETRVPQLPGEVPVAAYAYLGDAVKKAVKCPVMVSNRFTVPQAAENVLAMEGADLIGLCRTLVADPEWPVKSQTGREREIRPCVACNQGCLAATFFGKSVQCLANGMAGRENTLALGQAPASKKILVVGAGPAGCEVAVRAAQSGHRVVLAEKTDQIGGWVDVVAAPPGKHDFHRLVPYYQAMLAGLGVDVRLNTEITAQDVLGADYDAVVIATGGKLRTLHYADDDGSVQIVTAEDILNGSVIPGKDVVVLGAGAVGAETAQFMAHNSALNSEQLMFLTVHQAETPETISGLLNTARRRITLLEAAPKAFSGFDLGCAWPVIKDLKRLRLPIHTSTRITRISRGVLYAEQTDKDGAVQQLAIPCDTLVEAVGTIPQDQLYQQLSESWGKALYLIGNAHKTGRILDAVHAAIDVVSQINTQA